AVTGDPEPTTRFAPSGRIGTRVPHRWLDADHTRSTVDLAGPTWALLTAGRPPSLPPWPDGPQVQVQQADDLDFLDDRGSSSCAPDHIVGWRGARPEEVGDALRTILDPPRPAR
ncbi:MAG TPA: hypothetical protein VKV06_16245, partial [Acidimicrobiales bacterium]|nr:hypothetical protein [Acidimicrobiales bacterium]